MANIYVAMYNGDDGTEALYAGMHVTDLVHAVTNYMSELREQAGFGEDEVHLIAPEGIVDGEKVVACLAHSYDPDGGDWFDAITIEAVEFVG